MGASREKLADACAAWQSGRDDGSSLLRGAARVLTGVPHYFSAPFIRDYEQKACEDVTSLSRANVLLQAVGESAPLSAEGWPDEPAPSGVAFAGRGLAAKPQDDQILEVLRSGEIVMPLWGVSLSREIATSYGKRFLFVIEGPFHGVAAWRKSEIKATEQEVIAGGRYEVDTVGLPDRLEPDTEVQVTIRQIGTVSPIHAPDDHVQAVTR